MAIKDLFSKQKSQSVEFRGANKKSVDEFRQDVESGEEIKQVRIFILNIHTTVQVQKKLLLRMK